MVVVLAAAVISSSETSVLTKATRRYITEYGILRSHRNEIPQFLHCNNLLGSVAEK
jgi:hypothetical protein